MTSPPQELHAAGIRGLKVMSVRQDYCLVLATVRTGGRLEPGFYILAAGLDDLGLPSHPVVRRDPALRNFRRLPPDLALLTAQYLGSVFTAARLEAHEAEFGP
jgi:hypothetical protein